MVQLTAVDAQKLCRFYHVKMLQHASYRFTTISMLSTHFEKPLLYQLAEISKSNCRVVVALVKIVIA